MRYVVRTPDGELTYPSLGDVERAYTQGLVDPDDEVREESSALWRKAGSLPVLARARRPASGLAARGQVLAVAGSVALGVLALTLVLKDSWSLRIVGIVLALVVSSILTRVTFKAFKRPPPPE
ncbi:hypothetical protein MYSTI_03233 [Myxococcus stipitatus DSM 14675]|uniref:Uncharacterized protein n=1 Tax=Myxococcus stipitatus (strain DSM 14675 / JCM 12634 / Mx s8) TaxID=1278073 RepID=L7U6Q0_MYXSD|nr:hypothetical protein [Myxococcus stipitatus]AGC44546.1 hypothetical protein MYSTI_03233 [Myxococcus stipitatus DSM 14675]